jgi:hypothetical protein
MRYEDVDGQHRFMLLYGCRFESFIQMREVAIMAAFFRDQKEGWKSYA